ncbi:HPr kinase/phosphorylase [Pediococcus pentosaceus]|uniref:HPr(Ser) kinase/phosphatase n=1 Tax=Pediococcus pentosaceus TaxID=1255 RepID=UPI00133028A4|nr:HPr(Ser) kinase/phosphatase [Pediococcus pentosaceus]KAF0466749.1 HPr kinase/phosphorylase [Pediococcus pentosaceus]
MADGVSVSELVEKIRLDVFYGDELLEQKKVTVSDISRPGLELTNYFKFYPHERIQLFGETEISYAKDSMTKDERTKIYDRMADVDTPAFVVSRGLPMPEELIQAAKNNQVPILTSTLPTSRLLSNMTNFLEDRLAERDSIHGELLEIYGLGVLITGDSGIGKSETALDLIKRGHRLIADDRVDIYQQDEQTLIGEAPRILRHLLEIRGVGIIDVMNLFGASAVKNHTEISVIVHLQNWDKDAHFDRLGNGEQTRHFFELDIPKITIPVRVGRNLGDIIEAATMNFRAKNMGYDATKVFDRNLNELIKDNSQK